MRYATLKALLILSLFVWYFVNVWIYSAVHDAVARRIAFDADAITRHDIQVISMEKQPHVVHFSNGKSVDVGQMPITVASLTFLISLAMGPVAVIVAGNRLVFPALRRRRERLAARLIVGKPLGR